MSDTQTTRATRRDSRRRWRGRHVFVAAFALSFCAMALWSLSSPLFSGPDEPVHVMKAAGMVRGQLLGELNPSNEAISTSPDGAFTLPKYYAVDRKVPTCYHEEPQIPASCDDTLHNGGVIRYHGPANAQDISAPATPPPGVRCPYGQVPPCPDYVAVIYNARYPPLYYALVGLPSLLGNANWAVYLMRLLSAALSSLLIALALSVGYVFSAHRFVLLGVAIATTPMVLYLGGIVNPSGLEISAAICVFTSGIVLVREHLANPPPLLVAVLGGSAAVFESVRGLSPLWLACAALALLALCDRTQLRRLVTHRAVRIAAAVDAAIGVFDVVWILKEHALNLKASPLPTPQPALTVLEHSFQHNVYYIPGMVGVFGSFDTNSPFGTYLIWYVLIGASLLAVALLMRRREIAVVSLLATAVLVLPVVISSSQANRYGYTWSGRDTLPLAVGVPIIAMALCGRSALSAVRARLGWIVGLAFAVAQFAAFYEALRRYTVGTSGPDFAFLLHPSWHPVGGPLLLVIAEAIVLGVIAVALGRAVGAQRSDEVDDSARLA